MWDVARKCYLNMLDKLEKLLLEAVVRRCSVKKLFLKIPQNSEENFCAEVSFY